MQSLFGQCPNRPGIFLSGASLTHLLTGVRCKATSVAKKHYKWLGPDALKLKYQVVKNKGVINLTEQVVALGKDHHGCSNRASSTNVYH